MYNKLFAKILDSSIWLESKATRIVWITLIAAMDEDGYAHFSAIQNLADRAKVTLEEAEAAVACFMAPDPNSGNPDHDGRRVERVPGGFMVLNGPAHREEITRIIHREKTRLRVAKHRASKRVVTQPVTGSLLKVTPDTDTDTEGSEEGGKESADRPSVAEVEAYAAVIGLAPWKARDWWEEMESCGWLDYQHRAVVKWQPMLARVKAKWEADGRPSGPPVGKARQFELGKTVNKRNVGTYETGTDFAAVVARKQEQQRERDQRTEVGRKVAPTPPASPEGGGT